MDAPLIPFNRPSVEGREIELVSASVGAGHTASSGPYSAKVSELLTDAHDAAEVLLTTSCTDALEVTALLLELGPGDRVVVPSFTFVSTALAYVRTGAKVLFCDIEPDTLALDPVDLERILATHDDVRAVVHVHYAGIAGCIEQVTDVVDRYPGVTLIEDNAHGLFGTSAGRPLGTFGRFSTLSFHETKNFICGEGGALVLNEARDVERAHVLHDKGTDRRAFLLGATDKYTWRDTGSSFGMSDMLAAYLWGQLERKEQILARRRQVFQTYATELSEHAERLAYRIPVVPETAVPAWHMFYVLLADERTRSDVLTLLRDDGIQATFHYVPLHASEGGRRFAAAERELPVTVDISGRLLRLPFYNGLTEHDQERVISRFFAAVERANGA